MYENPLHKNTQGQAVVYHGGFALQIEDPAQLRAQSESAFSGVCCKQCCMWFLWSILIVIPLAAGALFLSATAAGFLLGILLAIAPSVIILALVERFFRHAVTRCQMTSTFLEAILWMIPLTVWIIVFATFIRPEMGLRSSGVCTECILADAFNAYVMAGFFEETLKFLAIGRLINKDFIVDPRSLLVYGICSAAGFATVENILYVSVGGFALGIIRAFISVPLHCACGSLIGMSLAENKFRELKHTCLSNYLRAIALPVIMHGSFDFALFVGTSLGTWQSVLIGAFVSILVLLLTLYIARTRALALARSFPHVDVHAMINEGQATTPCRLFICCCPPCCMK